MSTTLARRCLRTLALSLREVSIWRIVPSCSASLRSARYIKIVTKVFNFLIDFIMIYYNLMQLSLVNLLCCWEMIVWSTVCSVASSYFFSKTTGFSLLMRLRGSDFYFLRLLFLLATASLSCLISFSLLRKKNLVRVYSNLIVYSTWPILALMFLASI